MKSQRAFDHDLPARQAEAVATKVLGQDVGDRRDAGVLLRGVLADDKPGEHPACRQHRVLFSALPRRANWEHASRKYDIPMSVRRSCRVDRKRLFPARWNF